MSEGLILLVQLCGMVATSLSGYMIGRRKGWKQAQDFYTPVIRKMEALARELREDASA